MYDATESLYQIAYEEIDDEEVDQIEKIER